MTMSDPTTPASVRIGRRTLLRTASAGATAVALGAAASPTFAQSATPVASPSDDHGHDHDHDLSHEAASTAWLAVADPVARQLHVTSLDGTLLQTLEGVTVQTHAGFLPLANGQLLFVDEGARELVGIEVHGDHVHTHSASLPGTTVSHLAVDSDHSHYAAVGTDDEDAPIVLVDLKTWEATPVALPEAGEVGLMLTHDLLFHRNDVTNQVEAYAISDVLAGTVEPLSTVAIGPFGHGEAITRDGSTLFSATDDGIDVLAWDGDALTHLTTYGWDASSRTGGRGYFQRLSFDESHIVSYTANREAAETAWETWTNDLWLATIATDEVTRTELGTGYVFRFALTPGAALFARIGGDGDAALIVDLAPGSPTFGTVKTDLAIPAMTTGPKAGEDIYATNQYRSVAATPDGALGFVTQGGDGQIVVIDLERGELSATITVPSPLDGGGYLAVFGTADAFTDSIGR